MTQPENLQFDNNQYITELNVFYKSILNAILNGVWVTNKDDVIVYTNKGMEKIAGISSDQIIGSQVLKDVPESTLKFFKPIYLRAKRKLTPFFYDRKIIPAKYQLIYSLNPIARIIEATRKIFLLNSPPSTFDFIIILGTAILLFFISFIIYRKFEPEFAEHL